MLLSNSAWQPLQSSAPANASPVPYFPSAGLDAVVLPHWPQPAAASSPALAAGPGAGAVPLAIAPAAINAKLEVLRLHDMVAEVERSAQQAQHAAVADALVPFLLPCNAREANMAALDAAQWQHALGLLRDSALAAGRPWVAAACQLRLAWAELGRLQAVLELDGFAASEGGW